MSEIRTSTRVPSLVQRGLDRAAAALLKLPSADSGYTVTADIPVETRDGTTLLVDHYAPTGAALGTILVRSPYGRNQMQTALYTRPYAARGYHVVLARCRGTFGSGGAWEPMINEIDDGADTVAWLRRQPWFGGRFATLGVSYLGFTQWALLQDPPPELVTAIVQVGPHDFARAAYNGGAFTLNDMLGWWDAVAHQEEMGLLRGAIYLSGMSKRIEGPLRTLPVVECGRDLLGEKGDWFRKWISERDLTAGHWPKTRLADSLDRVQVPVLIHTGWQDIFFQQSLEQYQHLRQRGVDVAMTVGPWEHLDIEGKAAPMLMAENFDWLATHFGGTAVRRSAPVKVFVTGAEEWRDDSAWPPETMPETLYPQPGGTLGDQVCKSPALTSFTYDPTDPTPSIGGRLMSSLGGYKDDSELARRQDTLAFTGPALAHAVEIAGTPVVQLAHGSDNPHADIFVRLSDIDPEGRSTNVSEGFVRLDPAANGTDVRLDLDAVAHRFAAGHRISLVIAGGSYPRWERNLGTGADPAHSTETAPSNRTIDLTRSQLVLPVVS
ncbi:CocE/NonD family hydrolase [Nocardia sp. CA-084685]|uniref:CocE/NonD family hydrolase n=1 Tax=Nocardia sp. CA-084685 TaxID=3239970 RepID=UPI003D95AC8C